MTDDLVERLRVQKTIDEMTPDEVDKADFIYGHEMCVLDGRIAADRIEALTAEVERLREALQFYARENSWKSCGMYMSGRSNPSSAEIDRGDKARAALGDTQ